MRLVDLTACAKVLVRGEPEAVAAMLAVPRYGGALRDAGGRLVVATVPEQWMIIGEPGAAEPILSALANRGEEARLTPLDLTHAWVLFRLIGAQSASLLSKLCAIDLSDRSMPNGAAFRSSVAKLVADVVRDDVALRGERAIEAAASDSDSALAPQRSYLIQCDRPAGRYLFDTLLDAGNEFGIDVDGFAHGDP